MPQFARRFGAVVLAMAVLVPVTIAQITTTAVRGIVRDTSDAVVPNAALKLTDTATGIEKTTVSGADGAFIFANMPSGTYNLTATLAGFQNSTYSKIVVDSGRTTDVAVQLQVGGTAETVEVAGTATQLETSSNEVGKTIDNKVILDVPLPGRETLNFALLIPGVGNTGQSDRNSTFNGLPNASMDITVDGMNNNSQRWKSGGTSFFEFGPSRIDAMEQVTVSTTGLGADAGGQGAMQIRMTTKRGTDQYHFKILEQLANEDFNANKYFNTLQGIPRAKSRQNNEVGSFGGPLVPFSPYLKHKLFFFAYFEAQPQPFSQTNTTNILTTAAQQGDFTYIGTDGKQNTVNLLTVAKAAGLPFQIDPTIAGIQAKINASQTHAIGYLTVANQPYYTAMLWSYSGTTNAQYPAARIDYQITPNVAYHGSWNLRHSAFASSTGPSYPGSGYDWAGASTVTTYVASNNVDWSITPRLLNNLTVGVQTSLEAFNPGGSVYQWAPQNNQIINLPTESAYIPGSGNVPEVRNNPVYDIIDNLTWVKSKHTFTMGGTVRHTPYYDRYLYNSVPNSYNFGAGGADPAATIIQNALPLVNTGGPDVGNAQNLYAQLTGRLTSISGSNSVDEKTHQYVPFAQLMERYNFNTGSLYFQDSFRVSANLTLNYGLRWQFDGPISTTNGVDAYPTASSFYGPSTANFQPGVLNGNLNPVYGPVKNSYKSDLLNPAPNFGFAWNPQGGSGLMGKLLGERKTVIRGSYAINFYDEGLNAVTFALEANAGATQTITSQPVGTGNFPFGQLLSQPSPALNTLPGSFTFPMPMSLFSLNNGNAIAYMNPNLVSPYVNNWTLAIQRQLPGSTLLEVRYVGNKTVHMWHYQNVQETNIFENGFLGQFQAAQNNLAIANGLTLAQLQAIPSPTLKVKNFASTGLPGQVPTPIFDAAFGANGSNAALAASSGYANSGFITNLEQGAAASLAGSLASTATPLYYCRLVGANFAPCATQGFTQATQYPENFFQSNPFVTRMNYQDDNASTNYNALQVQARKSLSHGLLVDVGYTFSKALGNLQNASNTQAQYQWYTLRNGRLNYGPLPFDHRHTLTAFWTWDLPVGRGRLVNLNNKIVDHLFGGWVIGGVEKVISGYPALLTGGRATVNNLSTSGVAFGSGMTLPELRSRLNDITTGYISSCTCFKTNVADLSNTNGTPNTALYGPGQNAGQFSNIAYLYGKTTYELDMSLNKDFKITERLRMGVNFQLYNILNHPFLNLGNTSPTATTFGYISPAISSYGSSSGTFGPNGGTRTGQLRGYISW
jgi:Carboxypeptidase regulatory-like domain